MKVTVDRAVIEQALNALEATKWDGSPSFVKSAIIALRTALEQLEQEPVAWMLKGGHGTEFNDCIAEELKALTWKGKPMWTPLYAAPPQRKPLTEKEIEKCYETLGHYQTLRPQDRFAVFALARAIEAAHGIKD